MVSPTTTTTATTYTTIPISGSDVISRSIQNLSNSLSRCRPWPEVLAAGAGSIDLPSSLPSAALRLRINSHYFAANYAVVTSACAAASLIGSPISLIVVAFVYALWLVLFFFREDPMVVMGHHVSDPAVIVGLVLGSLAIVCVTGVLMNLLMGLAVGLLRNPEGLFLDEIDAVSNGLIISTSHNGGNGVS